MPRRMTRFERALLAELKVEQRIQAETMTKNARIANPPVFIDMPRPEQVNPSEVDENKCCPDGFFGTDHPNTAWLVNLFKDGDELRLRKALLSMRTRPLFEKERFYQIVDRPSYYWGERASLDPLLFNSHTMLYLTSFGVALYLKAPVACEALSKQSGRSKLLNVQDYQYAAFVYDRSGDLVKFHYDFMCIKREYWEGLKYLGKAGWDPCHFSCFSYRRKYYQYTIPFTDWMDVVRFLIKRRPSMNLAALMEAMFDLPMHMPSPDNFSMFALKSIGKVMMEAFELRELTRENFGNAEKVGSYAGRKVLRNKDMSIPEEFARVFADKDGKPRPTVRPVVHNVVSYVRRLLTYEYYFDGHHLFALPQILRCIECFKNHGFFVAGQIVKNSTQTDLTGTHKVYLDPMIFQIDFLINFSVNGVLMRNVAWAMNATSGDEAELEEGRAWYTRFDTFNCLSLLAGLLQNCLIKNSSNVVIEGMCELIIQILVDSELIEAFLRYSYYDTYFGLTSVVNCVPNLMSRTVHQLLKKAPLALVSNFDMTYLLRMFTMAFWKEAHSTSPPNLPTTAEKLVEFLLTKRRRVSMKVEGPTTGEAMSGASSLGAAGGITLFVRKYEDMEEITAADESAVQNQSETTRKQDEERKHVAEYRQMETDKRYSSVFTRYSFSMNKLEVKDIKEDQRWDDYINDIKRRYQLEFLTQKI